jgi:sucrose phosphorylase
MFDGVFNHVSSKSRWFQEFLAGNPDFERVFTVFSTSDAIGSDHLKLILRPRTSSLLTQFQTIDGPRWVWTTFSPDQIDLNFKNPRVLLKILEVLLFYVRHGADLLRLDAITYLWCDLGTSCAHLQQTHEVVRLFRDVLDVVAPHVGLVTETNVPHADNITYFGDGTDEAQMVYNFALPPLVLQAFQTGNASILSSWASDLEPPSETTAFFNFLDSHDGIGVMGARGILSEEQIGAMCRQVEKHGGFVSEKADGDGGRSPYELNITWFSALNREGTGDSAELQVRRFIASRAVALVLRGVPGIYLPSMIGHHNDLEAVVREGSLRSINRTRISERRLFRLLRDERKVPARIARAFLDLLEARVNQPAFHPSAAQRVLDVDHRVFTVVRFAQEGGSAVLCLTNVSGDPVAVSVPRSEAGIGAGALTDLIEGEPIDADGNVELTLEPYAVRWLLGHAE